METAFPFAKKNHFRLLMPFLFLHVISLTNSSSFIFVQESVSNVPDMIRFDCATLKPSAQDMAKCTILCAADETCVGVSMNGESSCFHFRDCPSHPPEIGAETMGHRYMNKTIETFSCDHGGEWNTENDRCDCKDGWTGRLCDTMAKTCAHLRHQGYADGVHLVNIDIRNDPQNSIRVFCRIKNSDGYSWILVADNVGEYQYNNSYIDFVNGFGDVNTHHFLGLENLYLLYQAGLFRMYVDIRLVRDQEYDKTFQGKFLLATSKSSLGYYNFSVISESWYGTRGTDGSGLGNCFQSMEGSLFSAWDSENDDNQTENCADQTGNGWWYRYCNVTCNLLGAWSSTGLKTVKFPGLDFDSLAPDSWRIRWYILTPRQT